LRTSITDKLKPTAPAFGVNVAGILGMARAATPQDGFYQAPGGNNCPEEDRIVNAQECKDAAEVVNHRFVKEVNGDSRPNGCFWDQSGGLYYNAFTGSPKLGWGGVGAMCKRRGSVTVVITCIFFVRQ
jgi:hypothetical protein